MQTVSGVQHAGEVLALFTSDAPNGVPPVSGERSECRSLMPIGSSRRWLGSGSSTG
ncbi:hypothetical protein Pve01_77890 [Planomonospora venezuelensis]|nr:hypothetical protein Pve01_77890 [Planomonospora venezuelensis]